MVKSAGAFEPVLAQECRLVGDDRCLAAVEHVGIEINAAGPTQRPGNAIDLHPRERGVVIDGGQHAR